MSAWSGVDLKVSAAPRHTASRRRIGWIVALLLMVVLGIVVAMLRSSGRRHAPPPTPRASGAKVPFVDTGGSSGASTDSGVEGPTDAGSKEPGPAESGKGDEPPKDVEREPPRNEPPRREPPTRREPPEADGFGGDAFVSGGLGVDPSSGSTGGGGSGSNLGGGSSGEGAPTSDPDSGASSGTTTTGGPVGGGDDGAAVDCNGDQVNDALQVAQCILADLNDNGVPDCCDEGTPCRTNTLSNGGFETGPVAICGSTCVDAPAAIADAWALTAGAASLGRSDTGCAGRTFEPPHGARTVQLGTACGASGALSQSVELPSASTLRLRFRATCGSGAQPVFVRVGIANEVFVDRVDCPADDGSWALFDHAVSSASGVVAVTVLTEGAGSSSGAWIDDLFLGVDPIECLSDLDGEGTVGESDLKIMFGAWSSNGVSCGCDLDDSGVIDGADLGILMAAWGSCGGAGRAPGQPTVRWSA
jgi:hypothetical protein